MSYKSIFQDVRGSVDYILMEGNHKKKTCESMSKYVHKDENLPVLMRRIQAAGRKTFLLTNSEWDFLFGKIHFFGEEGGCWLEKWDKGAFCPIMTED